MSSTDEPPGRWLPPWFQHPARAELPSGHHLRPLRAADTGLPGLPEGLDVELVAAEMRARTAFVYGVFDDEERVVLGIVRLAPDPATPAYDVVVRWTVPGCPALARDLAPRLEDWLDRAWPFTTRLVEETAAG